ncbi:Short-chain dehydrogenase/reductase family 16C member 6 [Neofusicoccum parvum]|uniref:Short-chain dehydrogenase/reductase family 16C member 6 n=2 Tax=Neofusicoccum parvum TaxID=310453 RepID=A0ACB5SMJ0_9PEZI|nr:putative short-chain dehydrogenase reductase family protein [Neofusicoccum parvum UCRNP2]GME48704.1 Short-chain dehydrogenase/reductase family 16C member 6 [Neofusicoccum parvum]GME57522.1 Short-chain dehydrogenase/reductase family 16C member 6 [Neofusicoccum parvum]
MTATTAPLVSRPGGGQPRPEKPWYTFVTIDVLAEVANRTVLHPFIACLIPLCLLGLAVPTTWPRFQVATAYAIGLTLYTLLLHYGRRLAFGAPRRVDLDDEVVVVTGGAGGLGLLIAEVYGMRGASVAVLDVQDMDEEAQESKGVAFYRCDVGDRADVERARRRIEEDLGTPTILINNAGVVNGKPLLSLSTAEVERNFRVNLLAHFNTLQTFLPGMLDSENGGTVVTVSSVLGKVGAACLSDYTAAKAGLVAMHTSLQAELKQSQKPGAKNIRTILVTPGQLRTSLFGELETPSSFLAPVVEPVQVAQAIIKMVDAGEGGEISFPLYARWMEWMNVLPSGLQWIIRGLAGVDDAMKNFGTDKNKST